MFYSQMLLNVSDAGNLLALADWSFHNDVMQLFLCSGFYCFWLITKNIEKFSLFKISQKAKLLDPIKVLQT